MSRAQRRAAAGVDWTLLTNHALAATLRRPGRSMMTATGVALGIAVFLLSVGWSQTVGSQINQTFDELAATLLQIRDTQADTATDPAIGDDVAQALASVDGVVAGGRIWQAGVYPIASTNAGTTQTLPVLVTDPGTFSAANSALASGRLFDAATVDTAAPAAVLGPSAAQALGFDHVEPGMAIRIGSVRVMVIGILADAGAATAFDGAVLVPPGAPIATGNTTPPASHMTALVRVELGAADQVAAILPTALRPDQPTRLGVLVPPEPESLHTDVASSLNTLALGAATLSLVVGAMGILNSMLMSVTQRSGEIGLRRAIGAGRRHIVAQFLLEGAVLGAAGGTIGLIAGEAALIALALTHGWSPVLDRSLVLAAPAAGLLTGIAATVYPSLRAAAVEPARSLRA